MKFGSGPGFMIGAGVVILVLVILVIVLGTKKSDSPVCPAVGSCPAGERCPAGQSCRSKCPAAPSCKCKDVTSCSDEGAGQWCYITEDSNCPDALEGKNGKWSRMACGCKSCLCDEGQVCQWPKGDESPWCYIKNPDNCDNKTQGKDGKYWSRTPCIQSGLKEGS